MSNQSTHIPGEFSLEVSFDRSTLIGARWWQHVMTLQATQESRRQAMSNIMVIGGTLTALSLIGGATWLALKPKDENIVIRDSLALQKSEGWDVGNHGGTIAMAGASLFDVDGSPNFSSDLEKLPTSLAPTQSKYAPYYVPTLFQSLVGSSSSSLRSQIKPIRTSEMDKCFAQGRALATLFDAIPPETAVIVDAPGPLAVAIAAGMSEYFEPVWSFDNWPHPVGVVPSHLTLGAALFYAPLFRNMNAKRKANAPPVFVLDKNRLTAYADDSSQFDNRYVAKIPSAKNFKALNIKHVLYVTPGQSSTESDDLNEDFVELNKSGIDIKFVSLDDFRPETQNVVASTSVPKPPSWQYSNRQSTDYYYGGSHHTHYFFWSNYSWYSHPYTSRSVAPVGTWSYGRSYVPTTRTTMFTGTGSIGMNRSSPSKFGQTTTSMSRSTGRVTGTSFNRSGSFGRSGSTGG